ncbi:MAG: hypothetical protein ACFFDI_28825 [Promethearchaeota archaeon]
MPDKDNPPDSVDSELLIPSEKNNKSQKKNSEKRSSGRGIYTVLRFLVRQLYRMQYGYTKLNVFVQIINTVSLLLLLFNAAEFLEVKWWHVLLIYISLIVLLLFLVFIFEVFGAWHTEARQIFRMSTSELWREQIELRSLLFAKYMNYTKEEIEERLEEVSKRLFPDKH